MRRRTKAWLVVALSLGPAACSLKTAYVHPDLGVAVLPADLPPIRYRVILIGDAGEPKEPEPVLDAVRAWALREPDKTLVVFLGDNAYPNGVVDGDVARSTSRLTRQAAVVADAAAEAVFVAGSHDWAKGGVLGLDAVTRQGDFLRGLGARLLPTAGCPGPEYEDRPAGARPVVRLVFLDTQWWLHPHAKGAGCNPGSPEAVVAALRAALATPLPVVVAAHHPLATHGPHGGFNDWQGHLFPLTELAPWAWLPLPGAGTIYLLARQHLVRPSQDLAGPANIRMRRALAGAFADSAEAVRVFAAGHEHALQVLAGEDVDYVLVSGAGSSRHSKAVGKGADTLFAHQQDGFMVLDVTDEGIRLSVVEPSAPAPEPVVAWLRKRPGG